MIFHKQHFLGWRFWILFFLSLILIISDQKKFFPPRIKTYLQAGMAPLQSAIVLPERGFNVLRDYFTLQHELLHDRKNWQSQQLLLQAKLQEMNTIKQQNEELKSLLKTPPVEQDQKYLLARVISINAEGRSREILINRGSKAGITPGQGMIASEGIVGQIIQVTPLNSRAILLTDTRSAVPVTNQRTRENFIVIGTGNNQPLAMLNTNNSIDIKIGDPLLSSGIGGHYPAGYPVGTISKIVLQGKNINQIFVQPTANLNRLNLVLVVFLKNEETTT